MFFFSLFALQTNFVRVEAKHAKPGEQEDSEKNSSLEQDLASAEPANESSVAFPQPTYISQLKIWNGTFSDDNFFMILLRPLPLLLSPVVRRSLTLIILNKNIALLSFVQQTVFVFLCYGMQTVWLSKKNKVLCDLLCLTLTQMTLRLGTVMFIDNIYHRIQL